MDAETKIKWLAALRSGEFAQARQVLKDRDGAMCCLAVLAHVCGKDPNATKFDTDVELLNEQFAESLGLSYDDQDKLAGKNDAGETFIEIADYIETNL